MFIIDPVIIDRPIAENILYNGIGTLKHQDLLEPDPKYLTQLLQHFLSYSLPTSDGNKENKNVFLSYEVEINNELAL